MFFLVLVIGYLGSLAVAAVSVKENISQLLLFCNCLPLIMGILSCILLHYNIISAGIFQLSVAILLMMATTLRPINGYFIFKKVHLSHLILHSSRSVLLYILWIYFA